jgi:hypothetical protein
MASVMPACWNLVSVALASAGADADADADADAQVNATGLRRLTNPSDSAPN